LFYAACVVSGTLCKAWGGENILLIILAAVGVGLAIGAANGSLVSYLKMPSIVVTLAMMSIVRGIVLVITDGVMITNLIGPFTRIASTKFGPLYITPMIWLIASFAVFFLVHKVRFGREILAMGSNPAAAERIGIDRKRINIIVFMLASALTGLAGAFYTSKIGNIQAQLGVGYEMKVIAAVIIGGTSFKGGKISLLGTFCGVILMGFIDNMLVLMRVPIYWQAMTIGAVLLAAVVSSAFTSDAAGKGIKFNPKNMLSIIGGGKDA
jgi:ribose/xylose/arabinose/galactoside ABC-type transport system permease subunit